MSAGVTKVLKNALSDSDVSGVFSSFISGNGKPSLSAAGPKYKGIRDNTDRYVKLLAAIAEIAPEFAEISAEAAERFAVPEFGIAPLTKFDHDVACQQLGDARAEEILQTFFQTLTLVKESDIVAQQIHTCKNLIAYKTQLGALKALLADNQGGESSSENAGTAKLTRTFVDLLPGSLFYLVAPTDRSRAAPVNFKQTLAGEPELTERRLFLLSALVKTYEITLDTYNSLTSPDMDAEEFTGVVEPAIAQLKTQLPGCDAAFRIMLNSTDLLRNKFSTYYSDYVESSNPTIIMENFVLDVSKTQKTSPRVMLQFRKIIAFYKKQQSLRSSDPKLAAVFRHVDNSFQEIERLKKKPTSAGAETPSPGDAGEGASTDPPLEADEAAKAAEDAAAILRAQDSFMADVISDQNARQKLRGGSRKKKRS